MPDVVDTIGAAVAAGRLLFVVTPGGGIEVAELSAETGETVGAVMVPRYLRGCAGKGGSDFRCDGGIDG